MPPLPTSYASPTDLEEWFGQERLASLFPGVDNSLLEQRYQLKLDAASALMNQSFARASYAVPVDPAAVSDSALSAQLSAQLKVVCCALAIGAAIGGVLDLPDSAKAAVKEIQDWLCNVRDGGVALLGVGKASTETDLLQGGRIGVTTNPGDPASLPTTLFESWRVLELLSGSGAI